LKVVLSRMGQGKRREIYSSCERQWHSDKRGLKFPEIIRRDYYRIAQLSSRGEGVRLGEVAFLPRAVVINSIA
jgi:hypothetical protein